MAKMDGVDISGYDVPIDVEEISADFVIVKVTEGLQGDRYNKWWRDMLEEGERDGKLLGVYHYANGEDPVAEADSFYGYINGYKGRVIPCLDWEGQGNDLFMSGEDVWWCETFMDRISERMGSSCLFYTSKGICRLYDWSGVADKYPLWGAEYAYENYVYQGYEAIPWQSSQTWGAWGEYPTIHQYGYVNPKPNNGGQSCLDADKFYGTREDWQRMCGAGGADDSDDDNDGGDDLRQQIVDAVRSQLGERYYSMNYSAKEGFGGVGTHYVGEGYGCAELTSYPFNVVLGTRYGGSTWMFYGDALGDEDNNQGGDFYFVDDPLPGDVVCYLAKGHNGEDYYDCSHVALYVGDDMVIGSWGTGKPWESDYWPGRGVSEDHISEQSLGNGWRFVRCRRLGEGGASGGGSSRATLDVDGFCGRLSVREWQRQVGTYVDGVISGQDVDYDEYRRNVVAVDYDGGGSQLVCVVQGKVGAAIDGVWGPETSRCIQRWLIDHGYDCGPAGVDGYFGHDSVCALQRSLNDGAWS